MYVDVRCSSCQGRGRVYVGSPTDASAFVNCFNCHGRGTVSKRVESYSGTAGKHTGGSESSVNVDARTDEEKRIDRENGIAGFLSLALGGLITVPVLLQGVVAWWIPVSLGIVISVVMTKVLKGPFRIIPIVVHKLIVVFAMVFSWSLILLFGIGLIYVLIKVVQVIFSSPS